VLQDTRKAVDAFKAAFTVLDKVTTGGETRDTVKTQSFTDQVLTEVGK
jgi:hypothetical protein